MRFFRVLIFFCVMFLLFSCGGFEPLYANRDGHQNILAFLNSVKFESTHGRSGQVLYTALYKNFKTVSWDSEVKYVLKIKDLGVTKSNISLSADGTSRLEQIIIRAEFVLYDVVDEQDALEVFILRRVGTYNVVGTDAYSTDIAFQGTRDRLLNEIADDLRFRVIAHVRSVGGSLS